MKYARERCLTLRVPPTARERLDALAKARGSKRHRTAVIALLCGVEFMERHGRILEFMPGGDRDPHRDGGESPAPEAA